MKKSDAIDWAGGVRALARRLTEAGHYITPQAISQWPGIVPELRVYQIRALQEQERK